MTVFQIKIFAILFMVIDHIGAFLFPDVIVFRIIGRLSFPLFAWLIANGAYYSKNIQTYLLRLLTLAVISQFPYILISREIEENYWALNIFFTLFLGLLAIEVYKKFQPKNIAYVLVFIIGLLGSALQVEYGIIGILAIFFFYQYFQDVSRMFTAQLMLAILPYVDLFVFTDFSKNPLSPEAFLARLAPLGLLSFFFIAKYNGKEGKKLKYFFYLFYPAHFLVLYGVLKVIS